MGREVESGGEMEKFLVEKTSTTTTTLLPLLSLNHVSFVSKCLAESIRFYEDVLGFVLIKRPSSFDFEGAWLFNYGIGIHLIESDNVQSKKDKINPKDCHISFECSDMAFVMRKLEEKNVKYVTDVVEEGGVTVDQLFFHDPDGYMVEICNCHVLPVLPLSSCPIKKLPKPSSQQYENRSSNKRYCSGEVEARMMENLAVDMMDISF